MLNRVWHATKFGNRFSCYYDAYTVLWRFVEAVNTLVLAALWLNKSSRNICRMSQLLLMYESSGFKNWFTRPDHRKLVHTLDMRCVLSFIVYKFVYKYSIYHNSSLIFVNLKLDQNVCLNDLKVMVESGLFRVRNKATRWNHLKVTV